jgi:hypothetical protein
MFDVVSVGPEHQAMVEDTFLRSVSQAWPWALVPWEHLRRDLRRRLRSPGTRSAVAVLTTDPSSCLGWAAVVPGRNEVVFAWTFGAYRSDTRGPRRFEPRIATTLVTSLGVDLTAPTPVRYWTPTAATLQARGYLIHPTQDTR